MNKDESLHGGGMVRRMIVNEGWSGLCELVDVPPKHKPETRGLFSLNTMPITLGWRLRVVYNAAQGELLTDVICRRLSFSHM
jgi:hypothetical protein